MNSDLPELNLHATQRAAQRNVSLEEIKYVINNGTRLHRAGAVFCYLRECDLSDDEQKDNDLTRLIGTAVVLTRDRKTVLTVWRNRKDGLTRIRRKEKYDIPQKSKDYKERGML